jgi:UDP-3-O-[3-hydroxymyristoyl] N-acetylglucosamine deacetylase
VDRGSYRTLKSPVSFRGVGVHTGTDTVVTINPFDHGISFSRNGCESTLIEASIDNVLDTVHGTSIGNGQISFRMVEHLLATLFANEIDGAHIIVENGDEIPILDGSALPLVQMLKGTEIIRREGLKVSDVLTVREPFHFTQRESFLGVFPAPQCTITYFISYQEYPELTQLKTVVVDPRFFEEEIAPARTYAFLEWIEPLQKQGLIKGGSLENSLVYSKDGFLNPGPLRFQDELVRHKILDFLGDLSLFGKRIQGHFIVVCGGHTAHIAFLRALRQHIGANHYSG